MAGLRARPGGAGDFRRARGREGRTQTAPARVGDVPRSARRTGAAARRVFFRAEPPDDYDDIRRINDEAFRDPSDAQLIDMIRASDRFVPELSLVAVSGGQILGHVISSYVDLVPGTRRVLQVGPLAVLPSHQRHGIGAALMEETLRTADERGEPLLLIEGNPKY